jgi:hypothetical protein
MRNQVDLFGWDSKYILENASRVLAHNNKAIGPCGDLLHDDSLVGVWLTKNSTERCNHWHFEALQQLKDMAAGVPTKDPILVLQTH